MKGDQYKFTRENSNCNIYFIIFAVNITVATEVEGVTYRSN